jgi:hypothetical protein
MSVCFFFFSLFNCVPDQIVLTPAVHPSHTQMQAWRRGRTGKVVADPKENSGTEREEDAETIAAYFELHGISSTALIAGTMDHVRTHLPFTCFHFLCGENGD